LTELIPANLDTDSEFDESLVRTRASMLSESCEAAVIAALLLAFTSYPLSSINISVDITGLPFDLILKTTLQQN